MGLHVAKILTDARGDRSRFEVEEQAGISARSLERYELRGQVPRPAVLEQLAAALGVEPSVLRAAARRDAEGVELDPDAPPVVQPLPTVLDGLVARHGGREVLEQAVAAAYRDKV